MHGQNRINLLELLKESQKEQGERVVSRATSSPRVESCARFVTSTVLDEKAIQETKRTNF